MAGARQFLKVRSSARCALIDAVIALAALVASLALVEHSAVIGLPSPGLGRLSVADVLLLAFAAVSLAGWRRAPLGAFVATASASMLLVLTGPVWLPVYPTVALYLLAAGAGVRRRRWTVQVAAVVAAFFVAYLAAVAARGASFLSGEFFRVGLGWAVAWFAGERTRLRREQVADIEQRAARVARDAERERLLAVAEERTRIARDLHDSAGHAINVIAVRAGAARLRHAHDTDQSLRALSAIEEIARQTAEDIDHFVGTLREDAASGEAVESPAGLASLDTLITHHADAGLEVSVDVAGDPPRLAHSVDQAAYRILQEALTNAARHGSGAASIRLEFNDAMLSMTVTNPVRASDPAPSGGGHGLIGMSERARLLDGLLEAGQASGVFRVSAQIPYEGGRA
jgi:signal transduction histidine kinase